MDTPHVTAALAVYNGAEYLGRALESMIGQTYRDFELLVVDDGSTDGSAEIAESFGARVIRQQNQGIGAARKRLVEEAQGEWIAFNDHDDWWAPNHLEEMIPSTLDPAVTLIYCQAYDIDENGRQTDAAVTADPDSPPLRHLLPAQSNILTPATLLRRQTLLDIGNFRTDMRIGEDTLAYFMLISRGKVVQVPLRLAYIFRHRGSTSAPGRSLYEHEVALYERYILPHWDELFGHFPPDQQAEAKRMIHEKLGHSKSLVAAWTHWEGDRSGAIRLHREAVKLYHGSRGAWYRYGRSLLGWKVRPPGAS